MFLKKFTASKKAFWGLFIILTIIVLVSIGYANLKNYLGDKTYTVQKYADIQNKEMINEYSPQISTEYQKKNDITQSNPYSYNKKTLVTTIKDTRYEWGSIDPTTEIRPIQNTEDSFQYSMYKNERYKFEIQYPDILTIMNRTGQEWWDYSGYSFIQNHQVFEFLTSQQSAFRRGAHEFSRPSLEILAAQTKLSIEQYVDEIIGCQDDVAGYADWCIERIDEFATGDIVFTLFHDGGPVYGRYHHVTKEGDIILDIQTFLPPYEESLDIVKILESLTWTK